MLLKRVIPTLLLRDRGLVKTIRFDNEKYVGDAVNAVRIFNEKEVDELILLDIMATVQNSQPQYDLIEEIAGECFMPLCYGGGIQNTDQMKRIFQSGIEKIALNTAAAENPSLVNEASKLFGSQSLVVSVDVKRGLLGKYCVTARRGKRQLRIAPADFVKDMEERGAGEILLNSIDRDGTQQGYDLEMLEQVTRSTSLPVIACGGASGLSDLNAAFKAGASAAAAGSLFVFHGKHRAVLITYPEEKALEQALL